MGAITKIYLSLLLLLVLQSPGHATACDSLGSLKWLLGDWYSEDEKLRVYESWKEVSDGTWEGFGKTESVTADKVLDQETLRLVEMSGGLFYLAKVAGNELPVPFKLTDCAEHMVIFENSLHDFPKALRYRLTEVDHMVVVVSGEGDQGFELQFKRKNVAQSAD